MTYGELVETTPPPPTKQTVEQSPSTKGTEPVLRGRPTRRRSTAAGVEARVEPETTFSTPRRGRDRKRGSGQQSTRGRQRRIGAASQEQDSQENDATPVDADVRKATPTIDAPIRTTRNRNKSVPEKPTTEATPTVHREQTIPTPPQDANDVTMEEATIPDVAKENTPDASPRQTQEEQLVEKEQVVEEEQLIEEEQTVDDEQRQQVEEERVEKTQVDSLPTSSDIPGLTAQVDVISPSIPQPIPQPDQSPNMDKAPEVGHEDSGGDVEMKDVTQSTSNEVQPQQTQQTQQEAPAPGAEQQQANAYTGSYSGYYNVQSGYDYQAYVEYYRAQGYDYDAYCRQYWADQQQQQQQQQTPATQQGEQQAQPSPQPYQQQTEPQPAPEAAAPIDYTQVPAPTNLPSLYTAPAPVPVQQEEAPEARKRKRGDTPLPVTVLEDSGNKKQKQDEAVQVEITEPQPEQQEQQGHEIQVEGATDPQVQTAPAAQEPGTEKDEKANQPNGLLVTPEKPRNRLSFTIGSRKTTRPVANDDESLADIEPEESEAPWNGFSTDKANDTNPPLHPPTRALYIDNLMRPLKEYNLRDHLASLAEPDTYQSLLSRTPADPVENCYLDPLKSHAFASFKTLEQAVRVRSALHNKVWPDERARKPLQVDYFPEKQFSEWVVKERQSSSDGRVLKWRVVYKSGDTPNSVRAVLEDLGESAYQPFQPYNKDFKHDNHYSNRRNSGGYNSSFHGYDKYAKNNRNRYYNNDPTSMISSPNFIPTGPRKSFDGNRRKSSLDHDRPRKIYEEPVHIDDETFYDDNFDVEKDTSRADDSKYYKSTSSKRRSRHKRISSRDYSPKEYRDYSPPPRDRPRTRTRSPTPARSRDRSLSKDDVRSPVSDRDRDESRGRSRERTRERTTSVDRSRERSLDSVRSVEKSRERSRGRSRTREDSRDRSVERGRSRSRRRSISRGRTRERLRSRERSLDREDADRSRRDASEMSVDAGPSKEHDRDRDMDHHSDHGVAEEGERKVKIMNMDELFMFTEAKPKLYYLPVSEEVARERLKHREEMHKNARRYWRKKHKW